MAEPNINIIKEQVLATKEFLQRHKNTDKLAHFAAAEVAGHNVAYYLKDVDYVPLLDDDGVERLYRVVKIHTKHKGSSPFVLAGIGDNRRVHVTFRGTDFFDGASVQRNLEYRGSANQSFHAERDSIISQILQVVSERAEATNSNVSLTINGHSQGGAEAQNCGAAIIEDIARAMKKVPKKRRQNIRKSMATAAYDPLLYIDSLTINHVNAAGVNFDVAEKCAVNARYVARRGLKIKVRALKVAGDGVQMAGETSILADVPSSIAHVAVLRMHKDSILNPHSYSKIALNGWITCLAAWILLPVGLANPFSFLVNIAVLHGLRKTAGTLMAHTSFHFATGTLSEKDFTYMDNSTPAGALRVRRELTDKSYLDGNFLSHRFKIGLHFGWHISRSLTLGAFRCPRFNEVPEHVEAGAFAYTNGMNAKADPSFAAHSAYMTQYIPVHDPDLQNKYYAVAVASDTQELLYTVKDQQGEMDSVTERASNVGNEIYKARIVDSNLERGFLICLLNANTTAERIGGGIFRFHGITLENARDFQRAYIEFQRQVGKDHAVAIAFEPESLRSLRAAGVYMAKKLGPANYNLYN